MNAQKSNTNNNMIRYIMLLFTLLFIENQANAQISLPANTNISTYNTASEGDYYQVTGNPELYIGMQNGSLKIVSDFQPKKVENELFFEDNSFYYVSMRINTNDFKVIRYNKTDLNDEQEASGTATQPNTLALVQGLTYN
jgi:hypothetical protein